MASHNQALTSPLLGHKPLLCESECCDVFVTKGFVYLHSDKWVLFLSLKSKVNNSLVNFYAEQL